MAAVVQGKEPVHLHMGIDFCGADVSVTQEYLHGAQISAAFKQMCGKGMPEGMGRNFARDLAGGSAGLDRFPDILPGKWLAEAIDKDPVALGVKGRPCLLEIAEQFFLCKTVNGYKTGFTAFADNMQYAALQVEIGQGKAAEFRHTQTCRIEQLENTGISAAGVFRKIW